MSETEEKVARYFCESCDKYVSEAVVDGERHAVQVGDGDWDFCGPVRVEKVCGTCGEAREIAATDVIQPIGVGFGTRPCPDCTPSARSGPLCVLAREINAVNAANGWKEPQEFPGEDPYHIPSKIALVHSEVSEALEAFRVADLVNFREELADTLIRVLALCGGLGIDIDAEVAAKLEKNRQRAHRHGGKRI